MRQKQGKNCYFLGMKRDVIINTVNISFFVGLEFYQSKREGRIDISKKTKLTVGLYLLLNSHESVIVLFPVYINASFPSFIPERSHHPVLHALIEVNCTLLQIFTAFAAILRADSFFYSVLGWLYFRTNDLSGFCLPITIIKEPNFNGYINRNML